MADIVKGVLSGARALIVGWILPTGLSLSLFALFILPNLKGVPLFSTLASATPADKALVLLVASVVLGLSLSATQTQLYRLLEGYYFPADLKRRRSQAHRRRRDERRRTASDALAFERLQRYPVNDQQIVATKLGNAIRRFEYYGQDRYQLDSQILWYQLQASAPARLGTEVDNARAAVDFFVCLLYTSAGLAVAALASLSQPGDALRPIVVCAVAILISVGSYGGALVATDNWSAAVRAMVDIGRVELAKSYLVDIPSRIEDERKMWQAIGWFVGYDYSPENERRLNQWRESNGTDGPRPLSRAEIARLAIILLAIQSGASYVSGLVAQRVGGIPRREQWPRRRETRPGSSST